MRVFCFVTLLLFAGWLLPVKGFAQAKEKVFSGLVLDSLDKSPLENCTVILQNNREASKRFITSGKGRFSFTSNADTIRLLLQRVGYAQKHFTFFLKELKIADTLFLSPSSAVMEGVVVKAKLPPVVVRNDTTEYNIDSSMFEPFDVVQDLLRRLPGLEIDAEGRMTFHGKPITRILVDGEDLFGGDPNFSLNKLPAGLVAKIQVMDTKTLEQLFSNTPADGEDKTLNIKLKAGDKNFGNAVVAAGTKANLDAGGDISRFNEGKRISLNGGYNSSNKTGLFKNGGGPAASTGAAGLNYGDKWGGLRFNGSYGYNQNSSSNESYRERTQQLTTDTLFFTKASNRFNNRYTNHRATLNANWWIDSSSILDATLQFGASKSKSENSAASVSSENGRLRNESLNNSNSTGNGQNFSASLTWRKWLNRKGRSLFVTGAANTSDQASDLFSQSTNAYFKNGTVTGGDTLNRQTVNNTRSRNYSGSFAYSEPLTRYLSFTLNGSAAWSLSTNDRAVYNLDSVTHKAAFDSTYSAGVSSSDFTQNLGASLSYRSNGFNLMSGLATTWQQTLRSLQGQTIKQNLLRRAPTLNAWYVFGKGKTLRAGFSATTVQPTADQLQPVPDNSNPLYVRLGNPALRTAFAQNYSLGYNYNGGEANLSAGASYAPVRNQILNAVTYDAFRRILSQAINVSGVYSGRANVVYDRYYRKGKAYNTLSISSAVQTGQQVYFQTGGRYQSRNWSVNGRFGYSRQRQGVRQSGFGFSVSPSYGRTWTPTDPAVLNTERFSLAPSMEGSYNLFRFVYLSASYRLLYNRLNYHSSLRANTEYNLHNVNTDLRLQVAKKWAVQASLSYQYNTQVPDGAAAAQVGNNLSVSGVVWKGRGQINLTAYDLFAAKATLQRVAGENYIEDVQINTLRNYFTVRLQWSFSKLERKEKKEKALTSNTK